RPGREALLAPQVCGTLERLWRRGGPSLACTELGGGECGKDVVALAWATSALAHESLHLRGVRWEGGAVCYWLQSASFTERARGVHGRAGQRPAHEDVERDREADRETGDRLEGPPRIGCGGEDDPDEEEGEDRLDHEPLAAPDTRAEHRRAELRAVAEAVREHPLEHHRAEDRRRDLREPVRGGKADGHSSRDHEAERHRWVE